MLIHEMTEDECRAALKETDFGRLACVRGDKPYIVPVHFSYDGRHLYGITTLGQKIEWMRSNPLVCLETDERTYHDRWVSIVVFGRYEELPDTPEHQRARSHALEVLQSRTMWWEPACVPTERRERRPPIFYRISIEQVTGRRATPDAIEVAAEESTWQEADKGTGAAIAGAKTLSPDAFACRSFSHGLGRKSPATLQRL